MRRIDSGSRRKLGASQLRFKLGMHLFSSPDPTDLAPFAALVARLGGAESIEVLARRHSAFHRARHIKSAADLLRLILAYAPGGRSLRRLAAEAAATGIVDVSDVALLARFRRCGDWLIALCENQLARRDEPGHDGVRRLRGRLDKKNCR